MRLELGELNIRCKSLENSLRFYRDCLGFEELERESGCVRLKRGNRMILLMPSETEVGLSQDLLAESLDPVSAKLQEFGYSYKTKEYQGSEFLVVKDPDGTEFEVIPEGGKDT